VEFFTGIKGVEYEGPESRNPFSFKFYDPSEIVGGKPLKDHLRFSVAYWHTFVNSGSDMFGDSAFDRPWNRYTDPLDKAFARVDALFEFCEKLGIEFFCFHDRDIAPEGSTLRKTNELLDKVVGYIKERMKESNLKVLWGTANLFSNPIYAQGAATSPSPEVFARAAAQVKKALEITKELGGQGYVFWGGREGYETLLNTNMELELNNLARFLQMAVDYVEKIGFDGQLLIEPKPKEPTKHQYDFDVANSLAFLKTHGLDSYFKFNIEANHATLAGHTFAHELRYARIHGKLGSIDANQGDLLLGWDTDQFPTNVYETTLAMYEVIKAGGFAKGGGLNFDAKVRRSSSYLEDLVAAHIAGMDAFALGFKVAYRLWEDRVLEQFVEERYSGYNERIGKKIVNGDTSFEELEKLVLDKEGFELPSGQQERLEAILNQYLFTTIKR